MTPKALFFASSYQFGCFALFTILLALGACTAETDSDANTTDLEVNDVPTVVIDTGSLPDNVGSTDTDSDSINDVVDVVAPECTTTQQCLTLMEELAPTCAAWICNTNSGRCVLTAVVDGSECDDNNICTDASVCSGGICVPIGVPRDCTDTNSCTVDACNKRTGCSHTPKSGGQCDDGNACTSGEHCVEGECTNGEDICPAQCGNGFCQTTKGESCSSCPQDCGGCPSGCSASTTAGCNGCACEPCVCSKMPTCCTGEWTDDCVDLCKGACQQSCDGCTVSPLPTCGNCECESCVCEKVPSCCTDGWTALCVAACEVECGNNCR